MDELSEVPQELTRFFAAAEDTAARSLLGDIADAGGWIPLVEALDGGHTTGAIAAALEQDPKDGRQKPRVTAQTVGGVPVLILSARGWAEMGEPNRRPLKPRAERLRHTLAPRRCAAWLRGTVTDRMAVWTRERSGTPARISVLATGTDIAGWTAEVEAAAWAKINSGSGGDMSAVGALTRREAAPRPDLVVIEEWANAAVVPPAFWSNADRPKDANGGVSSTPWTMRIGIEVETAAKATADLETKLRRLQACIDLGVLNAVVWVVDDRPTADRLGRFGVSDRGMYSPMYYASTQATAVDPADGPPAPFLDDLPLWWAAQYAPAH